MLIMDLTKKGTILNKMSTPTAAVATNDNHKDCWSFSTCKLSDKPTNVLFLIFNFFIYLVIILVVYIYVYCGNLNY